MLATGSTFHTFDPKTDISPLTGKVILITGGNVGIGRQVIIELARHKPARIWLAARSPERMETAVKEITEIVPGAPIKTVEINLASFASIRKAAKTVLAESDRLDFLICNAGIMAVPAATTEDGYEIQFGTNHMGHALLTRLLLPLLKKTAAAPGGDVRVVLVTSKGHRLSATGQIDFSSLRSKSRNYNGYTRYGQSKLANILFARQLAKRHPDLTVAAVHPGVVMTNLMANTWGGRYVMLLAPLATWMLDSVENAAKNPIWACVADKEGGAIESGEYYVPVGVAGMGAPSATDDELAEKLWEWTEKELDTAVASGGNA